MDWKSFSDACCRWALKLTELRMKVSRQGAETLQSIGRPTRNNGAANDHDQSVAPDESAAQAALATIDRIG